PDISSGNLSHIFLHAPESALKQNIDEYHGASRHHEHIGKIENIRPDAESKKIHYIAEPDPVDDIADSSSYDESDGTPQKRMKFFPKQEEKNSQRRHENRRNGDDDGLFSRQHAQSNPVVRDTVDVEEIFDNRNGIH